MKASLPVVPFVPREYEVIKSLEVSEFRLRMLTVNDVVKDYDAVMSPTPLSFHANLHSTDSSELCVGGWGSG